VREQNSTINSTIIGHRQSLQPYWQKSSKHYRKIHTSVQLNKPIETLDTETSVSDGVPEYRQAYAYTDRWQNAWCVPALHTATTDSAVGEAKPETHWCSKQDASSYTHIIIYSYHQLANKLSQNHRLSSNNTEHFYHTAAWISFSMHSRSSEDIAASALDMFSSVPRMAIIRSGNITAISWELNTKHQPSIGQLTQSVTQFTKWPFIYGLQITTRD